jgi:A/G-specific adenine glycosylase
VLGALLAWFDDHARPLAWRRDPRDPYATLVAETMLQQTQAARVERPFLDFVARFPDLTALAAADEEEVLRHWQGLGYYRRARRLHEAARRIVSEHGGEVPRDPVLLARLPGVGRYTAVAVAAQAHDVPGIAVDANVRRLGARVLGMETVPASPRDDLRLEIALAERLGARLGTTASAPASEDPPGAAGPLRAKVGRAGAVVEALMELGARVCTARRASCPLCPLERGCAAAASGEPLRFGRSRPPRPRREERLQVRVAIDRAVATDRAGACDAGACDAVACDARVALERRPGDGRWAGLWGFPLASPGQRGSALAPLRHVLTHRLLTLTPILAPAADAGPEATWIELSALIVGSSRVPVASVDRKVARAVAAALKRGWHDLPPAVAPGDGGHDLPPAVAAPGDGCHERPTAAVASLEGHA